MIIFLFVLSFIKLTHELACTECNKENLGSSRLTDFFESQNVAREMAKRSAEPSPVQSSLQNEAIGHFVSCTSKEMRVALTFQNAFSGKVYTLDSSTRCSGQGNSNKMMELSFATKSCGIKKTGNMFETSLIIELGSFLPGLPNQNTLINLTCPIEKDAFSMKGGEAGVEPILPEQNPNRPFILNQCTKGGFALKVQFQSTFVGKIYTSTSSGTCSYEPEKHELAVTIPYESCGSYKKDEYAYNVLVIEHKTQSSGFKYMYNVGCHPKTLVSVSEVHIPKFQSTIKTKSFTCFADKVVANLEFTENFVGKIATVQNINTCNYKATGERSIIFSMSFDQCAFTRSGDSLLQKITIDYLNGFQEFIGFGCKEERFNNITWIRQHSYRLKVFPQISYVCASDGIKASIKFPNPFTGFIYSAGSQCSYPVDSGGQMTLDLPYTGCGSTLVDNVYKNTLLIGCGGIQLSFEIACQKIVTTTSIYRVNEIEVASKELIKKANVYGVCLSSGMRIYVKFETAFVGKIFTLASKTGQIACELTMDNKKGTTFQIPYNKCGTTSDDAIYRNSIAIQSTSYAWRSVYSFFCKNPETLPVEASGKFLEQFDTKTTTTVFMGSVRETISVSQPIESNVRCSGQKMQVFLKFEKAFSGEIYSTLNPLDNRCKLTLNGQTDVQATFPLKDCCSLENSLFYRYNVSVKYSNQEIVSGYKLFYGGQCASIPSSADTPGVEGEVGAPGTGEEPLPGTPNGTDSEEPSPPNPEGVPRGGGKRPGSHRPRGKKPRGPKGSGVPGISDHGRHGHPKRPRGPKGGKGGKGHGPRPPCQPNTKCDEGVPAPGPDDTLDELVPVTGGPDNAPPRPRPENGSPGEGGTEGGPNGPGQPGTRKSKTPGEGQGPSDTPQSPKESGPDNSIPGDSGNGGPSPKSSVPQGTIPKGSIPGDSAVPEGSSPGGPAPKGPGPQGSIPEGSVPGSSIPDSSSPKGSGPRGSPPGGSSPQGSVPDGSSPGGSVPEGSPPGSSIPDGSSPKGSGSKGSPPGTPDADNGPQPSGGKGSNTKPKSPSDTGAESGKPRGGPGNKSPGDQTPEGGAPQTPDANAPDTSQGPSDNGPEGTGDTGGNKPKSKPRGKNWNNGGMNQVPGSEGSPETGEKGTGETSPEDQKPGSSNPSLEGSGQGNMRGHGAPRTGEKGDGDLTPDEASSAPKGAPKVIPGKGRGNANEMPNPEDWVNGNKVDNVGPNGEIGQGEDDGSQPGQGMGGSGAKKPGSSFKPGGSIIWGDSTGSESDGGFVMEEGEGNVQEGSNIGTDHTSKGVKGKGTVGTSLTLGSLTPKSNAKYAITCQPKSIMLKFTFVKPFVGSIYNKDKSCVKKVNKEKVVTWVLNHDTCGSKGVNGVYKNDLTIEYPEDMFPGYVNKLAFYYSCSYGIISKITHKLLPRPKISLKCGEKHFVLRLDFPKPFYGSIYTLDPSCVANGNDKNVVHLSVERDKCGTIREKNDYKNTLTIKYVTGEIQTTKMFCRYTTYTIPAKKIIYPKSVDQKCREDGFSVKFTFEPAFSGKIFIRGNEKVHACSLPFHHKTEVLADYTYTACNAIARNATHSSATVDVQYANDPILRTYTFYCFSVPCDTSCHPGAKSLYKGKIQRIL